MTEIGDGDGYLMKAEKISKRKKDRIENKKRKIRAFLEVAKANEADDLRAKIQRIDSKSATHDSSDGDASAKSIPMGSTSADSTSTVTGHSDESAHSNRTMGDEELKKLRAALKERQKKSMQKAKIWLVETYAEAQREEPGTREKGKEDDDQMNTETPPLFVLDVQHLVLYALQGQDASYKPRWCRVLRWNRIKHVLVLVLDAVSAMEYAQYQECFPNIQRLFHVSVEMVSPSQYDSTVAEELFRVPLSKTQLLKDFVEEDKGKRKRLVKGVVPVTVDQSEVKKSKKYKFPQLHLILSPEQLMQEGYPLPVEADMYSDFVYSREEYTEVTESSPLFAVDCEMVFTSNQKLELARVSIVNEKLELIYDTLVKPRAQVRDYLTRYSGITKRLLQNVNTRLEDVQQTLQGILPSDAILCGQSLNGDLLALKMFHPYVIDTSVIYNLSGQRDFKPSLKRLTAEFLGRDIQASNSGHSSAEDATATMELVQLKLDNGLTFGDVVMGGLIFPAKQLGGTCEAEMAKNTSTEAGTGAKETENETATKSTEHCTNKPKPPATDENETGARGDKTMDCDDTEENDKVESKKLSSSQLNCDEHQGKESEIKVVNEKPKDQARTLRERKKAFFKRPDIKKYTSLFEITKKCGKSVSLIDAPESLKPYLEENISYQMCEKGREVIKQTRDVVGDHAVTWAQFHSYQSAVEEERNEDYKKKKLEKLDKYVGKVVNTVPEDTMITVLMSGRTEDTACCNAMCFVKIT